MIQTFLKSSFVIITINLYEVAAIRVCRDFTSYYNPSSNNCYDNTEVNLNNSEIIRRWGFTAEEYRVQTEDGYILTVFRAYRPQWKGTPVVLGHGIYMSSLGYSSTGNKSLAHILVDSGYDVWLCNYRGTKYSRKNVKLDPNDPKFWEFSVHEMGLYDLPGILKLVQEKTHQKAVYIGFSMGTTAAYIYTSSYPKDAKDKLKGFISMAPVAYLTNVKSWLRYGAPFWKFVAPFTKILFHGELLRRNFISKYQCSLFPFQMYFCETIKSVIFGDDFEQMDPEHYPVSSVLNPDTISQGVITHFVDIIMAKKFVKKDFGRLKNKEIYGSVNPPEYAVENITLPNILFVGENDWLATPQNAKNLYNKLNPSARCGFKIVPRKKFMHTDFLTAKDAPDLLYHSVVAAVKDLDSGTCTR